MQKIYRFVILRALANAVFEARDETSGATVSLYQWTPPLERREQVKQGLSRVEAEIEGEVFSADASLYLVGTKAAETAADLTRLRSAGLFTGRWLNEEQTPAPPPPVATKVAVQDAPPVVPISQTATATVVKRPFWTGAKVFVAILIFSGIAAFAGAALIDSADADEISKLKSRVTEQTDAAAAVQGTLSSYQQLNLLRFRNGCHRPVRVAIRYRSYSGAWVTQGWWQLKYDQTALLAVSPSKEFYAYAEDEAKNYWSNKEGKSIQVVDTPFAYVGTAAPGGLQEDAAGAVKTMLLHSTGPNEAAEYVECDARSK